jgi:cobaltochelatase CobT
MASEPSAFMSYVRSDDDHDAGRITKFRERLEGEVRMQNGKAFPIFQDRNDIAWGQQWKSVINDALSSVRFLIPIVTPSFFESDACRSEFETFLQRENMLGVPRLILPVYYVPCEQLEEDYPKNKDAIADILRDRNWTDWREFRFIPLTDQEVAATLARLARTIKTSIREIEPMIAAASAPQKPAIVTRDVEPQKEVESITRYSNDPYDIPEATLNGAFDKAHYEQVRNSYEYFVYTTRFDEVIDARSLVDEEELLRLYGYLIRVSERSDIENKSKPLTDALTDLAAKGMGPKSLSATILLDLSGSMRGAPITGAATAALHLTRWLDRWSIRTEVLGYTTRAWKGGQSREAWVADGKLTYPAGRLNDLRHIVFKSFDESAGSALPNLGLTMREGLLKENIDGESLLWAYARLNAEKTNRKHLFVLSDGAPVDDSTLSVNPGNFLETHLKGVVGWMAKQPAALTAVGIGHDVSRYFPGSGEAVTDPELLGISVIQRLKPYFGELA